MRVSNELADKLTAQANTVGSENIHVSDEIFEKVKRIHDNGDNYRWWLCIDHLVCPICGEEMNRIVDDKEKHVAIILSWVICPVHGAIETLIQ